MSAPLPCLPLNRLPDIWEHFRFLSHRPVTRDSRLYPWTIDENSSKIRQAIFMLKPSNGIIPTIQQSEQWTHKLNNLGRTVYKIHFLPGTGPVSQALEDNS